jgi:hypothetical protein
LLGGELVEQPLASASCLYRHHALVVACRAVRKRECVGYVYEHKAKLEPFAERAGNACGVPRTRRVIHSA